MSYQHFVLVFIHDSYLEYFFLMVAFLSVILAIVTVISGVYSIRNRSD